MAEYTGRDESIAHTMMICKHNVRGTGFCKLHGEYCHESACPDEELVEYVLAVNGRWVIEEDARNCRCSNCGIKEGTFYVRVNRYCRNCGAKMNLEDEK